MVGNEGSRLRVGKSTEIDEFVSERLEMRGKAVGGCTKNSFSEFANKKKRTCCTAVKKPRVIKRASNYTPLASTASILRYIFCPTFSVKIGEREWKREKSQGRNFKLRFTLRLWKSTTRVIEWQEQRFNVAVGEIVVCSKFQARSEASLRRIDFSPISYNIVTFINIVKS